MLCGYRNNNTMDSFCPVFLFHVVFGSLVLLSSNQCFMNIGYMEYVIGLSIMKVDLLEEVLWGRYFGSLVSLNIC